MNQRLAQCVKKSNNLQLMKFLAAIMVICSHAFPIVEGNIKNEPLYRLTGGQLSFGGLAVAIFFLSAGFFIASSVEKKRTAKAYFTARCLRIFPLLWIVVIASILLGAVVTSYTAVTYWSDKRTWLYLLNGLLIPVHNLPGVFENNSYLPTVNGALWTLPVEFACYIACFLCYKLQLLQPKFYWIYMIPASVIAFGLLLVEGRCPFLMQIYRPCFLFIIGMGYWIYREKIVLNFKWIPIGALLLVLSFVFHLANVGMFVIFPYLCMLIWFCGIQVPEKLNVVGDMSYGIYLCGFPIQQLLSFLYGKELSIECHMLLGIVIACVVGFLLMKIENILETI